MSPTQQRTTIRTLAALLLLATHVHASGAPIPVCIALDGAVRVMDPATLCKPAERALKLAEWEADLEDAPDPEAPDPSALRQQLETLAARISALESVASQPRPDKVETLAIQEIRRRVSWLEDHLYEREKAVDEVLEGLKGLSGMRHLMTAPFEIIGSDGRSLLRVDDQTGPTEPNALVSIGKSQGGGHAIRIHGDDGHTVAGMGISTDGGSAILLYSKTGDVGASMYGDLRQIGVYKPGEGRPAAVLVADAESGTVAVNHDNVPVVYMTRSTGGDGGNITAALNNGFGVFSAGAAQDGGGEACLNRVTGGGAERIKCLGIDLPSMGMGKN